MLSNWFIEGKLSSSKLFVLLELKFDVAKLQIVLAFSHTCSKPHVAPILKGKPDLLIAGEAKEWETPELVRDARALSRHILLLVLGHAVSEEPGMTWMARWLQR